MEMENTQTAVAEPNQDAFVDDFRSEMISQEDDTPIENKPVEYKQVENKTTVQNGNKPQDVINTQTVTDKPVNEQAKDPLISQMLGEDGSLDPAKFTSFFGDKEIEFQPLPDLIDPTIATQTLDQNDDTPEYLREIKANREYETNLQQKMLMPLELYNKALQAGYSNEQAMAYAQGEINKYLSGHFEERKAKSEWEKGQSKFKKEQEASELAQLKPKADAAFAQVAPEFGGAENVKNLLLNPKYGGDFLLRMFDMQNNDKFKNITEKNQAIDKWFLKFQSNPDNLRFALDIAQAKFMKHNRKAIFDYIQKKVTGNQSAGANAQLHSASRTATIENKKQLNDLDRYLGKMESQESEI